MARHEIARAILVTGSGSGIGAAIARRLAGPGTGIPIHANRRAGCARAAKDAEVAALVQVLCSKDAGYITDHCIHNDGGFV